jgi:hypothetical protein
MMEKITGISLYSQNINGLSNFKFTQLLYAIRKKKKKSFFNKLQIFSDCKHFNTSLALKQYYLSAQEESVGASLLGGDRHRGPGADVLDG